MSTKYCESVSGWPHMNAVLVTDSKRDMHDHWRLLSSVVTERSNIHGVADVRNPHTTQTPYYSRLNQDYNSVTTKGVNLTLQSVGIPVLISLSLSFGLISFKDANVFLTRCSPTTLEPNYIPFHSGPFNLKQWPRWHPNYKQRNVLSRFRLLLAGPNYWCWIEVRVSLYLL
jgi:hypothetical protein